MNLGIYEIHLWFASLAVDIDQPLISHLEAERASSFQCAESRRNFVMARSITRRILSHYTHSSAGELLFRENQFGKPEIEHPIRFNYSHSKDQLVIAMALEIEVGVDLELVIQDFDWREIASDNFHEDEVQALNNADDFYRIWTRKEAVLKCLGYGMHLPLHTFNALPDLVAVPQLDGSQTCCTVRDLERPPEGYRASLAYEGDYPYKLQLYEFAAC